MMKDSFFISVAWSCLHWHQGESTIVNMLERGSLSVWPLNDGYDQKTTANEMHLARSVFFMDVRQWENMCYDCTC